MAKHYEYQVIKHGNLSQEDIHAMEYVHCGGFIGQADSTLCGLAFEGSFEAFGCDFSDAIVYAVETQKKISCPVCIEMIESCKKLRKGEYIKVFI